MSVGESVVGNLIAKLTLDVIGFTNGVNTVEQKVKILGGILTGIGVGTAKATKKAVDSAVEFEKAFTGVTKTVDAPDAEKATEFFADLRQGILDMSNELPVAATEIAGVYQSAGQLGIQSENLENFSRAMIQLASATNLSSEEAATSLAQFANVTKMDQTEFDRLGSSIVELGNNMATDERQISNFASELAVLKNMAGMSEADIVGLGSAMASLGLEPAAASTAMQRLTQDIVKSVALGEGNLEIFAEIAGQTAEEFQTAWGENATNAFITFIDGLGGMDSAEQLEYFDILDIKQMREIDMLQRLAGNSELVADAVAMSNKAWDENTSLTDEADKANSTTAAQMQLLNNNLTELGITLGTNLLPTINKILEALKPIIDGVTKFIGDHPKLTAGIIGVGLALGMIGGIMTALMPIITMFNAGLITINAPVLAVAGAVVGLIAVLALLSPSLDEIGNKASETAEEIAQMDTATQKIVENGVGELSVVNRDDISWIGADVWDEETGTYGEGWAYWDDLTNRFVKVSDEVVTAVTQTTESIAGMSEGLTTASESLTTTGDSMDETKSTAEQAQEIFQSMQTAFDTMTESTSTNTEEMETSLATINELLESEQFKQLAENPVAEGVLTSWTDFNSSLESVAGNLSDVESNSVEGTLDAMATSASNAADAFQRLGDAIKRAFASFGGKGGGINTGIREDLFKAGGGSVYRNTPYVVGEDGAEVFVPNSDGYIVPNDELEDLFGERVIVNVGNVYGESYLRDYVIDTMVTAIKREVRIGA